jgi:hypothetical protein
MKKTILNMIPVLLMIALLTIPSLLMAQPGFDDDVADVPIDGGLSILLAAGVGYGAKKIHENRKKNQEKND